MVSPLDLVLLGPAPPYRGGIADTQVHFAKALQKQKKSVELWTFTTLYPSLIFPGKTQFSTENIEPSVRIHRKIHAFFPLHWKNIAQELNEISPKVVVFRYWTPYLALCWSGIAKHLDPKIKRIALVDNWRPHESHPWDNWLNRKLSMHMDAFSCLSEVVKKEIETHTEKPVWGKMHPISQDLPPKIDQVKARKTLGINPKDDYLLFFGLIRPYKGLDLLIEALASLSNKKLLIVGECYENTKKYTRLVQRLKLEERVIFENRFVSLSKAAQYFSAASAVVLPYKSATQSGVLSMAYHYTVPLIVTDHPGISQPVKNDETGIVCAPSAMAVAEAIKKLDSSQEIEKFKKNMEDSKSNYSWENFIKEWIAFASKE